MKFLRGWLGYLGMSLCASATASLTLGDQCVVQILGSDLAIERFGTGFVPQDMEMNLDKIRKAHREVGTVIEQWQGREVESYEPYVAKLMKEFYGAFCQFQRFEAYSLAVKEHGKDSPAVTSEFDKIYQLYKAHVSREGLQRELDQMNRVLYALREIMHRSALGLQTTSVGALWQLEKAYLLPVIPTGPLTEPEKRLAQQLEFYNALPDRLDDLRRLSFSLEEAEMHADIKRWQWRLGQSVSWVVEHRAQWTSDLKASILSLEDETKRLQDFMMSQESELKQHKRLVTEYWTQAVRPTDDWIAVIANAESGSRASENVRKIERNLARARQKIDLMKEYKVKLLRVSFDLSKIP